MREHLVMNSWSTVYLNFGKIQEERQSAGNFIFDKGSSETRCEAFILKDNLFKFWLIGFTEKDDSFIINKNGYLEFKITQSSSDAQVLFYIKKQLGFGTVRIQDKTNNTHCYRIRDRKGLFKIISIFNGNIFLDTRKQQFKLWFEAYNKKYKENILYLENINIPTLNNSWLCGFTDAEGCFTCSIIEKPYYGGLVRLRYILSQKGNKDNMIYLADFLKVKHIILKVI